MNKRQKVYIFLDSVSTLLHFLASELGKPLGHIGPGLFTIGEGLKSGENLIFAGADLLGGVTVTEGEGVVLNGLEVDSDTEGGTQLVVASVTLTNGSRGVVHTVRDTKTAQLGSKTLGQGLEGRVGGQRNQQHLGRGNGRGERQDLERISIS